MVFILGTGDAGERCCGCDRETAGPCGDARLPTLVCRTAEVGLSKCGFFEFTGYESDPPKVYLTSTLAGAITLASTTPTCDDCVAYNAYSFYGTGEYTRPDCSSTDTRTGQIDSSDDCISITSTVTFSVSDISVPDCVTESFTSDVHTLTGAGCSTTLNCTGTATNTLSNEYTTAQLKSDVEALTVSFTGPFDDACSAFLDLSADEISISRQELQYKFTWPFSLTATRYSCYRIDWSEVFTPDAGSVVTTPRYYVWNGTDTETPIYSISAPTSYGTVVVTAISASCYCE